MAMKGTKGMRHGSDGGSMPKHNGSQMHKSMGSVPGKPVKTDKKGGATSHSVGMPHGSMNGAGTTNKMPKEICYAQGPRKIGK